MNSIIDFTAGFFTHSLWFWGLHALAFLAAIDSLLVTRSAQGAIAWGLSLLLFPPVFLPLYLIFGRPWLRGYTKLSKRMKRSRSGDYIARGSRAQEIQTTEEIEKSLNRRPLERLANGNFISGNELRLLIDGEAFFQTLLKAISDAKLSIDLCFYVVRHDQIGQRLKDSLIEAARRGVIVRFLYDSIGSYPLSPKFNEDLRLAKIEFKEFSENRGWRRFLHLNFRNHRKIAIIDRCTAFVGGFNIGDEYLGRSFAIGKWRDTHLRLRGPIVSDIESIFAADWEWATGVRSRSCPSHSESAGQASCLAMPTGPADEDDRAVLFLVELFTRARSRLWISSPYFVPDEATIAAMNLAVVRGVDVRLIIPKRSDNLLVQIASLYYARKAVQAGIKVYQFGEGFLHQKIILVDSDLSVVTTANLDNRSLRLNFELSIVIDDKSFNLEVDAMLKDDLSKSKQILLTEVQRDGFLSQIQGSFARLISPLL